MSMTPEEREFWRALVAPFPPECYRQREGTGGKVFTYLESRTIMNRIDDVCGPSNWTLEFRESTRGIICRITLRAAVLTVPVWREGGGSFRDLKEQDFAYKTGFSSALKTAASAFGIGRDLYEEGMPAYCADLFANQPRPVPQETRQYDNRGPGKPPFGNQRAVFPWAKGCGEHFHIDVLGRMLDYAKKRGKPTNTKEWTQEFSDEAVARTIQWLAGLPQYKGEFNDYRNASPTANGRETGQANRGLDGLREAIISSVKTLIAGTGGRAPSPMEVWAAIGQIASSVKDGYGHSGEVLEDFDRCDDQAWLQNILRESSRQIEQAARRSVDEAAMAGAGRPVEDDIPF